MVQLKIIFGDVCRLVSSARDYCARISTGNLLLLRGFWRPAAAHFFSLLTSFARRTRNRRRPDVGVLLVPRMDTFLSLLGIQVLLGEHAEELLLLLVANPSDKAFLV